ncbi:uncharacterized protein N7498_003291 [Penicillium cinerascens]|uniref:Uncharacterized protein n=1 Tax=Penicillium cinerascens TaxID=70096 RepID=A0A9W9N1R2_9EURO|nr:uncharacterized protein N7498_003291 [Penicillium cinerascens]KAJ5211645.1 hypothetical protein N7498_003291 [Penicillium cinerascens]
MASQGFPVQGAPLAPVAAPESNEQAQPIHSVMNTPQTDSEPVAAENAKAAANVDNPEASKPPADTQPPVITDHPLGVGAASEAQAPVEATGALTTEQKKENSEQEESKPTSEPNIGEKRDIDSITAPISEDKDKPTIEKPDESKTKKQKTEPEPVTELAQETAKGTNGTAPAPAPGDTNREPKKAAPPKKGKVKDAVKEAIPTGGIGSRTRSRTKPT